MIAQRLYALFVLVLLILSWKIGQAATETIKRAEATQAAQIERILAGE